jgi:hypothetical protein
MQSSRRRPSTKILELEKKKKMMMMLVDVTYDICHL